MGNGYMDPQVAASGKTVAPDPTSESAQSGPAWESNAVRREALMSDPPPEPVSSLLFDSVETTAVGAGWIEPNAEKKKDPVSGAFIGGAVDDKGATAARKVQDVDPAKDGTTISSSAGLTATKGGIFLDAVDSAQERDAAWRYGDAPGMTSTSRNGVVGKDGRLGVGTESTLDEKGTDGARTTAAGMQIYADGAGATASLKEQNGADRAYVGTNGKAAANYKVTVEDVKGSDPPLADLVVTIQASVQAGVGGGTKADAADSATYKRSMLKGATATAGVTVSVKASGEIVVRRRMAAERAKGIRATLLSGRTLDTPDLLATLTEGAGAVTSPLALASPGVAATLGTGDLVSLTMTVDGEVGASVGAKGKADGLGASAGVEAKASAERKRTVTVKGGLDKANQRTVTITVSFGEQEAVHDKASAGYGAGAVKRSEDQKEGTGSSATFTLRTVDPDYARKFDAIVYCDDASALRALTSDPEMGSTATSRSMHDEAGSTTDASLGPIAAQVTGRESYEEKVVGGDKPSFAVNAENTVKLGAGIGSVTPTVLDDSMHATATGDADGTDLFLADEVPSTATKGFSAQSADVLEKGPWEALEARLSMAMAGIAGVRLVRADLAQIAGRAANREVWLDCGVYARIEELEAWKECREGCQSPATDPELANNPVLSRDFGVVRALGQYTKAVPADKSGPSIDHLLRDWQKFGGAEGGLLGTKEAFPPSMRADGASFAEIDGLMRALSGTVAASRDDAGPAIAAIAAVASKLVGLRAHVDGAVGTMQAGPRAEILDQLEAWQVEIDDARRAIAADGFAESETEPTPEQASAEVARMEALVGASKRAETDLFAKLEASSAGSREEVRLLDELEDLYEQWVPELRALRDAYARAGLPEDRWKISARASDIRSELLEPWPSRYIGHRSTGTDSLGLNGPPIHLRPPEEAPSEEGC